MSLSDRRILVADDNAINRRVAQKILLRAGYCVEIVADGRAALQACKNQFYDVVLMDCSMPDMDGQEVAQQIRKLEQQQPIIIAVTALSHRDAREKCMDDLMNGYLAKPYSEVQLLTLIREKLAADSEAGPLSTA